MELHHIGDIWGCISCNVGKARVNHPQAINGWYKPSKHGWFITTLLTLYLFISGLYL